MVMQVPRVLLIWEEHDEPLRNVVLWSDWRIQHTQEGPEVFGELVQSEGSEVSFCTGNKPSRSPPGQSCLINGDLQSRFAIEVAATAAFHGDVCSGRIFMLDRTTWAEEDVPLVKIISERVGIELEDRILRRQLEEGAVTRERVRLGRDLHDGVLQGLAAANIQLKVLSDQLPSDFTNRVSAIRGALADEAHRIRDFVEESRSVGASSPEVVSIGPELHRRCEALGIQWGCAVDVIIEPPELLTSAATARHLDHIVGESSLECGTTRPGIASVGPPGGKSRAIGAVHSR